MLAIQVTLHGASHWRAVDARLALESTSALEKLDPRQRHELADADRLNSQAVALYRAGKFADAIPITARVAEIRRGLLGQKSPLYATALNNLAERIRQAGDYAKAEPLYRQSLAIDKQVLGEKHPDYANVLNSLAALYANAGEFSKAEPLFQQALEIRRETLGERNPNYAQTLQSFGEMYLHRGDYAAAEPLFQQALAVDKIAYGEKSADCGMILNSLSEAYLGMGDDAKAERCCRQAEAILKESLGAMHPAYASCLRSQALLDENLGYFDKAESLLLQASKIYKQVFGEKHRAYATSLGDLADLYASRGDYAKAEPLRRAALAIDKQSLGEMHPGYAADLNNLARLYADMGDLAKAEPLYRQSLAILKAAGAGTGPDYAAALSNLALLYADTGDYADATPLAAQALEILRERLDSSAGVQSERQQLRMADELRCNLNVYLSVAGGARRPADEIYEQVLAWKGAVSGRQQAMRRMRQLLESKHLPELTPLFTDLSAASRELANQARIVPKPGEEEPHRQTLADLSERVDDLQRQLARKSRALSRQIPQPPRTPDDIRRALPPGAVLIDLLEYDWYFPSAARGKFGLESHVVAFVVRPDQPVRRIDLGPRKPIAAAIESWRKNFGVMQAGDAVDPGQELRRLVWEKLKPHVGAAKLILLSPDGATARFPWSALPGDKPGTYLIEDTPIAIVPIPRLLPELLTAPPRGPADQSAQAGPSAGQRPQGSPLPRRSPSYDAASLLLVGGVDFGADPGPLRDGAANRFAARGAEPLHWNPLPGTAAEIADVKAAFVRRFPRDAVLELTGAAATHQALSIQMGQYRYLHLSTHGFFAPPALRSVQALRPGRNLAVLRESVARQDVAEFHPDLLSGLVLAGANRPWTPGHDDGILTALEISGSDLSHVELATLSACQTGLGESAGGEGLLGLQRAFQLAGAKTTVASLWRVPDKATQLLMDRFYGNLWTPSGRCRKSKRSPRPSAGCCARGQSKPGQPAASNSVRQNRPLHKPAASRRSIGPRLSSAAIGAEAEHAEAIRLKPGFSPHRPTCFHPPPRPEIQSRQKMGQSDLSPQARTIW